MDTLTKRDLRISFIVGVVAGILLIPILPNIGLQLSLAQKLLAVLFLIVFTPFGYLVAYLLSGRFAVMIQFVKFGISGGLNALIYLGTLNLLISFTGIAAGVYYSLFISIAFLVAVTNSYFWNKYWTFRSTEATSANEFSKFFIVNLIAFGMNVGMASIVVNVVGAPSNIPPELWANIGAVSAVAISLIWNFVGMKFIVFKK